MTVRVLTNLEPVSPPDYTSWFDLSSRPLLELALKDVSPAWSCKVEWLVDRRPKPDAAEYQYRVLTNYTQILRRAFSPKWLEEERRMETFGEAARRTGEQFLDDVELVLWYGKPSFNAGGSLYLPFSTCGGVLHYLRRRVYENDTVRLRPLSELMLRDFRDFADTRADGEWLWEFSLQVNPGHYQRGMKPLVLPPKPSSPAPKAWAQGASLEEESH